MKHFLLTFALIFSMHAHLDAQGSDAIVGLWITPGEEAVIQIEKTGAYYSGKILQVHPDSYINGIVPKDAKNEDASLRKRSLEGIAILSEISYDRKKGIWDVKHIYDPNRGKHYEGFIVMQRSDKLKLRGHVPGQKWLGETESWKRQ